MVYPVSVELEVLLHVAGNNLTKAIHSIVQSSFYMSISRSGEIEGLCTYPTQGLEASPLLLDASMAVLGAAIIFV